MTSKRSYRNAKTGDRLRFIRTAAETEGALLELEVSYTPVHVRPAAHLHPVQCEHFEVLMGQISVDMNGEEQTFTAGQAFDVPAGMAHSMWNSGSSETTLRWQIVPALKTQQFFETVWELAEVGKLSAKGTPNLLQAGVLMQAYAQEFRLLKPPRPVQIVLFGVLGLIGRLLGYKA